MFNVFISLILLIIYVVTSYIILKNIKIIAKTPLNILIFFILTVGFLFFILSVSYVSYYYFARANLELSSSFSCVVMNVLVIQLWKGQKN